MILDAVRDVDRQGQDQDQNQYTVMAATAGWGCTRESAYHVYAMCPRASMLHRFKATTDALELVNKAFGR